MLVYYYLFYFATLFFRISFHALFSQNGYRVKLLREQADKHSGRIETSRFDYPRIVFKHGDRTITIQSPITEVGTQAIIGGPILPFPKISLCQRSAWHSTREKFGKNYLKTGNTDFDRRYIIKTPQEMSDSVSELLKPEVLEILLNHWRRVQKFSIDIRPERIVCKYHPLPINAKEYNSFIETVLLLTDTILASADSQALDSEIPESEPQFSVVPLWKRGSLFFMIGFIALILLVSSLVTWTTGIVNDLQTEKEVRNLISQSQELRLAEEWDLAIAKSTEAIERDPGSAEAFLERAKVYYWSSQYDLAIVDSEKAYDLGNGLFDAWLLKLMAEYRVNNNMNDAATIPFYASGCHDPEIKAEAMYFALDTDAL